MCETYKKSWSMLFKNKSIFLPTIIHFIIIYLLLLITLYASGLTDLKLTNNTIDAAKLTGIIKEVFPIFLMFFILDFILTTLATSIRLGYIKQVVSNKIINIKKDLQLGLKNFKDLLLLRVIIFLIYTIILLILITLLISTAFILGMNSITSSKSLVINGYIFSIIIAVVLILIGLFTLNTYPSLFLKDLKGKKAIKYSYNLFKNNKLEVLKTVLGILFSAIVLTIVLMLLTKILNFIPASALILNLIFTITIISWNNTYIMLKFKELKSPQS